MKQTQIIMGMPVTLEVIGEDAKPVLFRAVFDHFRAVDERFSTYKSGSEISQINRGLPKSSWSPEMKYVMGLCEQTKQQTGGYFDIEHHGQLDPSGLVKGWAIQQAAEQLKRRGVRNFYVEAGGDIQVAGHNDEGQPWTIGIRNPFNRYEIIKTVTLRDQAVATSGTSVRGQHIYNPLQPGRPLDEVVSLTVIGPNIYDADRFATAAFAMGPAGIQFIEALSGFEGYMISTNQVATLTRGFERYVPQYA